MPIASLFFPWLNKRSRSPRAKDTGTEVPPLPFASGRHEAYIHNRYLEGGYQIPEIASDARIMQFVALLSKV
jgi:hypothetical protein